MGNQTAVITGGTSGIGKAVAAKLLEQDVNVIIAGRDQEKGKKAVGELANGSGSIRFVACDVSKESDLENLFNEVKDKHQQLDYLFNNAGIEGSMAPVTDFMAETCDELAEVNIKGTLLSIKHALPLMLENGGTIVNNASFVGTTVPFPNGMMYGATKAAVLSMTSTLSAGYSDKGIRSLAVCPWMTATPMVDRLTGGNEEARAQLQQINPSGNFATPEDIAEVVVAMFMDTDSYGSGEAYLVDAGSQTQQVKIPYQMLGV